jgi:pimeloyl-ACP methyl ester carboxylesterase
MATPTTTKHSLPGVLGPILIDVRAAGRNSARPAVLVVHGFKGFKDWGMFPVVAERIARSGCTAVSFNVSGSGVDDAGEFVYPERFGHNTFSAELSDIALVLETLRAGRLGVAAPIRIGLLGHSRGGGMGILCAAEHPAINALVTWAAISRVDRWPNQKESWRAAGRLDIVNTRTGQVLPLYPDVLDDIKTHGSGRLDILGAAGRITVPWLILHGAADPSVPVAEGEALAQAAPASRLLILPEAGHTFGAVHPFNGTTPQLAEAIDETVKWFGRNL